jgi:hypothetical protein
MYTTGMKKNIGQKDKAVRSIVAAVFIILSLLGVVSGVLEIVLLVIAGVLILISAFSFCGLYTVLGVNTCPIKETETVSK